MTEPENTGPETTAPVPAVPGQYPGAPVPPAPAGKTFPRRGAAVGLAAAAAAVGLIVGVGGTAVVGAVVIANTDGTHGTRTPGQGDGRGPDDGLGPQAFGEQGPQGQGGQGQGLQGQGGQNGLGSGTRQAPHTYSGQS